MSAVPLMAAAAAPPGGAPPAPGAAPTLMSFVPLILIAIIFYLLVLRPQQQKAKEHREMVSRLKVGDKVVTSSGIYGDVVGVDETTIMLRVADGVEIRFVRSAVSTVLSEGQGADAEKQGAGEKPAAKASAKGPERTARRK